MRAEDRTWLLDLDNIIGSVRPRPGLLRARVQALLAAAGPLHHAVAGYAVTDQANDPVASTLAELGVSPLRVPPGPDAAELALLAHARHVHAVGGAVFLVSSADRRFSELRDLGRLELLVWDGQPVAAKLTDAAHQVRRLPRPRSAITTGVLPESTPGDQPNQHPGLPHRQYRDLLTPTLTALATGAGIAAGHHLTDTILRALRGPT